MSKYFFYFLVVNLLHSSYSLQSGYTCQTTVKIACPESTSIVILEVTYSTECNEGSNETSIYAPSRCIGYYRDRISSQCNGQEDCLVDNSAEQRPSFLVGKQANCAFKGQSVNIEYSCIPDFYEEKLPVINICSNGTFDGVKEGFIHSPNYPNGYPNNVNCTKIIPTPESKHRLKIYTLDFEMEGMRLVRGTGVMQINDWLEINQNGEKFNGKRPPFTLLFDDVIEASIAFQSDSSNAKREYPGFLLYFIVAPIRRTRPTTTTTEEPVAIIVEPKTAALFDENQGKKNSNIGLVLLVVLLSTLLVLIVTGFLLYKRRNDRRMRYFAATFNSSPTKRSAVLIMDPPESSSKVTSSIHPEEHIYSQDPLFNEKMKMLSSTSISMTKYSIKSTNQIQVTSEQ